MGFIIVFSTIFLKPISIQMTHCEFEQLNDFNKEEDTNIIAKIHTVTTNNANSTGFLGIYSFNDSSSIASITDSMD